MDTLRRIFSSLFSRLSLPTLLQFPTLSRFSMNPPCEITVEFFYLCGHTVTSRHCRKVQRIWREGTYFDPAIACNESCPARSLPYMIHMNLRCTWCRYTGSLPGTNSVRSDQGIDVIPPMELQRRRDFYLHSQRSRINAAWRMEICRRRSKEASWETCKRLGHEWADSIGMGWEERTYFVGGTIDTRLYIPINRNSFPDSDEAVCGVCMDPLWETDSPIRFPCHITHRYHMSCVKEWLMEKKSCPSCRHRYRIETYRDWEHEYDNREYSRFLVKASTMPVETWLERVQPDEDDIQED